MFSFILHLPCSLGIDFQRALLEKAVWIALSWSEENCWCLLQADRKVSMFIPSAARLDQRQQHVWLSPWRAVTDRAVLPGDSWLWHWPQLQTSNACFFLPLLAVPPPTSHVIFHVCSQLLPLCFCPLEQGAGGSGVSLLDCLACLSALAFCFTTAWQHFFSPACSVRAKPEGSGSSCSQLVWSLGVWKQIFWGQLG